MGVCRTFKELKVTRDHSFEYTEFDEVGLYEFLCAQWGLPMDRVKPAVTILRGPTPAICETQ